MASVDEPIWREPHTNPGLAAVVLNHRTPVDTARAVESVLACRRAPDWLIVVDNDATPDCREAVDRWLGRVTCICTGQNLGFSGGMNAGVRAALSGGARRILLLNSDIVLDPNCIERLERAFLRHPDVGIAGPLVLSSRDPDVVDSAGISYSERTGRVRVMTAAARSASSVVESVSRVHAVSGSAMLVGREVFDTIGYLDERYFFGFEDLDFCLRGRAGGYSTVVVRDAIAYHEGSRTIGKQSARRFYFATRNHLLVASRRRAGEGAVSTAMRLSSVALLNVAHGLTAPVGTFPARMRATSRGLRDFLSGRYGPDPVT